MSKQQYIEFKGILDELESVERKLQRFIDDKAHISSAMREHWDNLMTSKGHIKDAICLMARFEADLRALEDRPVCYRYRKGVCEVVEPAQDGAEVEDVCLSKCHDASGLCAGCSDIPGWKPKDGAE